MQIVLAGERLLLGAQAGEPLGERALVLVDTDALGGLGPAGGAFGGSAPGSAGATSGLISAIASTDLRIAAPIVVPRPVVSVSMACSSGSRSVVGATATCANPENSTSPMPTSAA